MINSLKHKSNSKCIIIVLLCSCWSLFYPKEKTRVHKNIQWFDWKYDLWFNIHIKSLIALFIVLVWFVLVDLSFSEKGKSIGLISIQ